MGNRNLEAEELAFLSKSVAGAGPGADQAKIAEVQARMAELRRSGGAGYKGEAAQMRQDLGLKVPSFAELLASRRGRQSKSGAMASAYSKAKGGV
jgi:hypothetical protein